VSDEAFRVDLATLRIAATGLQRPECVLALSSGELIASHGAGGYSVCSPGGTVRHVIGRGDPGRQYVPNGIALAPDGRVLFADLGAERGGIFAVEPHGDIVPVVTEVEGMPLPPSNFVVVDHAGVLWFTVSTRQRPRSRAWTPTVADGFIGVVDSGGRARIVADGLAYVNEIAFSPNGRWVYTNETYGQRVSRFPLLDGPTLGSREVVAQLDGADLPDGITFDVEGCAWITCIASNRLLRVAPDGRVEVVLADSDEDHVQRVAEGVRTATLRHAEMQTAGRSTLGNISSLAFAGPDRKTAVLGSLLDHRLRCFASPFAGAEPAHWHRRLRGS
jgi:sugar lactone lactonase YvrE